MPQIYVDTSLFEPATFKLEDGRILTSGKLSPRVTRGIDSISKRMKNGELDNIEATVQMMALVYRVDPAEFDDEDIRVLDQALEQSLNAMVAQKRNKAAEIPPPEVPAVDEVTAAKNAPKPEGEVSQ